MSLPSAPQMLEVVPADVVLEILGWCGAAGVDVDSVIDVRRSLNLTCHSIRSLVSTVPTFWTHGLITQSTMLQPVVDGFKRFADHPLKIKVSTAHGPFPSLYRSSISFFVEVMSVLQGFMPRCTDLAIDSSLQFLPHLVSVHLPTFQATSLRAFQLTYPAGSGVVAMPTVRFAELPASGPQPIARMASLTFASAPVHAAVVTLVGVACIVQQPVRGSLQWRLVRNLFDGFSTETMLGPRQFNPCLLRLPRLPHVRTLELTFHGCLHMAVFTSALRLPSLENVILHLRVDEDVQCICIACPVFVTTSHLTIIGSGMPVSLFARVFECFPAVITLDLRAAASNYFYGFDAAASHHKPRIFRMILG
ncbi:hypothetical protein B0H10DRAFT_2282890 [Mycena sp. CBHHK59/15]|nr:hypothetical protein B0H10DRAFT_2282890 [Mycena sp. CBHHK59/15]